MHEQIKNHSSISNDVEGEKDEHDESKSIFSDIDDSHIALSHRFGNLRETAETDMTGVRRSTRMSRFQDRDPKSRYKSTEKPKSAFKRLKIVTKRSKSKETNLGLLSLKDAKVHANRSYSTNLTNRSMKIEREFLNNKLG